MNIRSNPRHPRSINQLGNRVQEFNRFAVQGFNALRAFKKAREREKAKIGEGAEGRKGEGEKGRSEFNALRAFKRCAVQGFNVLRAFKIARERKGEGVRE